MNERQKMLTLACSLPRTPALAAFWARVDANLKASEKSPKTRKHTKFQTCERHRWLESVPRARRAEFFSEGGPAEQQGCRDGLCRMWPGTDLFVSDICESELELPWTKDVPEMKNPKPSDFTLALNAMLNATAAIRATPSIKSCTFDNDHKSAEIIFIAGETEYVLRLKETND